MDKSGFNKNYIPAGVFLNNRVIGITGGVWELSVNISICICKSHFDTTVKYGFLKFQNTVKYCQMGQCAFTFYYFSGVIAHVNLIKHLYHNL